MLFQITELGFKGFKDACGFPSSISSKKELSEYLTVIIFNVSVFHAAVNFQVKTLYMCQKYLAARVLLLEFEAFQA